MESPSDYLVSERVGKWDLHGEENLTPLGELQKDSFLELAAASTVRCMPIEVPLNEPINMIPKVAMGSINAPGSLEDVLAKGFSNLGSSYGRIENAQQFYSWFSRIEEEINRMEGLRYQDHLETVEGYKSFCDHINADLGNALTALNKLENEYIAVSTKTNALHEACEHLLSDQTSLMNTAENVKENLQYFLEYKRVNQMLSSKNLALTSKSFTTMLTKIDDCIEFMNTHPTYKESSDYLEKYKTCLDQALDMIKTYVVQSLESSTKAILNRKNETADPSSGAAAVQTASDDAFTLYYGKFRTNAPKIKALMEQIETRFQKNDKYQVFLSDIHNAYFSQRELLMSPSVSSAMQDLVTLYSQDHCALVRSGCAFMVHVCEDEYQLFSHFFSVSSPKLHEMLVRLCSTLYDMLRPLIIHVYHLETLAELCTILKTEMIDDHVQNNSEQLQAFHQVALQMLEDVQERLVYRANIYIRDDILGYKPSPGDLTYPEKLEMMQKIAQDLNKTSASNQDGSFTEIQLDDDTHSEGGASTKSAVSATKSTSPADMHGMWFPTVRRVLVCLSKLYRCIDKTIFQGLSQEALQACVRSLVSASEAITARNAAKKPNNDASSVCDGHLFLVKHLLILREQITPFQAEFAIKETQLDFSRTKDAAARFVFEPNKSLFNLFKAAGSNSLVQLLFDGTPEVKECYIDSKKDVDRQLKIICELFIRQQTDLFCHKLNEFIQQSTKYLSMMHEASSTSSPLRQQPFATPELVHSLVQEVYKNLKKKMKDSASNLTLYLANKDTENILFKPVKINITQTFQQLQLILGENYTQDDRNIIAAPTPDQISLLISTIVKM